MSTDTATPIPGTVYTFPLANGLHGACRVIRAPAGVESTQRAGQMLICAARWVGEPSAVLKHPDTKKILRGVSGLALYWIAGPPPARFAPAGIVATPKADLGKSCHSTAPWEIFPNIVYRQWRDEHEPDALAAERAASEEEGRRRQAEALERLEKHERFELDGFVPLPKPRTEREPEEVLRGFIAAMNQWERESDRIAKKPESALGLIVGFNRAAQQRVFDEFCTPKERKYGRLGSFSTPPEYEPLQEEILEVMRVGPRRVEIETQRHTGFKQRVRYVLLKTKGMWLIDSKKVNGADGTL